MKTPRKDKAKNDKPRSKQKLMKRKYKERTEEEKEYREKVCMVFGANVKRWRESRGMYQKELADAVKLNESFIGLIERGQVVCSFDRALRIAEALGVGIEKLFEGLQEEEKEVFNKFQWFLEHRKMTIEEIFEKLMQGNEKIK